jgi:hypothetical protein
MVVARRGGVVWCTARTSAAGFYQRAGLVARGASYDVPAIGPRITMYLPVEAALVVGRAR